MMIFIDEFVKPARYLDCIGLIKSARIGFHGAHAAANGYRAELRRLSAACGCARPWLDSALVSYRVRDSRRA